MHWTTVSALISGLAAIGTISTWALRKRHWKKRNQQLQRAEDELHPLLKDHTYFRSYTTKYATYPNIRTFYRPHNHGDKHKELAELPLLVFIHGLGGLLPQFAGILGSLTNVAPCFGLELAGHGRSTFAPKNYEAFTIEANVALWKTAIEEVCREHSHQKVLLVGHSMGCSIAALLTSKTSPSEPISVPVIGVVAICPRARQISLHEMKAARRLFAMPDFVIDILRWFDRLNGEESTSVRRVVGDSNESDLKRMQLAWNRQFRTPIWKREGLGLLPKVADDGTLTGGYPSESVWKGIQTPLFLMAGAADTVCKPEEVDHIVRYITNHSIPEAPKLETEDHILQSSMNGMIPDTIQTSTSVIQTIIFPPPAAHALLYAHTTYRLVSALIESFLQTHVDPHLDFTYQLRLLTGSGKWDVKNLEKWRKVLPVSAPIHASPENPHGLFRALKTMREQDDEHNPTTFVEKYADKIFAVIDISHDAPVYDSKILDRAGVQYHKFPTTSKVPPTPVEVSDFAILVDKLLSERDAKNDKRSIAVHCHYGYNRTGFFIVSYLIMKKGFGVQEAIEEFATAKPPGIKHEHFLDVLWLRFADLGNGKGRKRVEDRGKEKKPKMEKRKSGLLGVPSFTPIVGASRHHNVEDAGYLTEGDLM